MKLKQDFTTILKTPNSIKKAGFIVMASGILFSCNDGNKKENDEEDVEFEQTMEVEEDTTSDNTYSSNAVADYLTYMDREGQYDDLEETDPEKALQKFAAAISERSNDFGMQADEKLSVIGDSISTPVDDMETQIQTTVSALEKLQEDAYDDLSEEVDALKEELKEIDMQADDSKDKLRSFFKRAADVVEEMDAPETDDGTMSSDPGAANSETSQEADTIEVDQ